jgi:hypothetical protein
VAEGCQGKESNPNDGRGSLESMEGQMPMRKKAIDEKRVSESVIKDHQLVAKVEEVAPKSVSKSE